MFAGPPSSMVLGYNPRTAKLGCIKVKQSISKEDKMLKKTLKTMSGVIAAGVLSVTGSAVLAEVNVEGETVTIIIPFKEGGGTSRTFRFFQPYLSKYLPVTQ